METHLNPNRVTGPSLPYLDNWRGVLITLAANVGLVFATNIRMHGYDARAIAIDAAICGLLTAALDVLLVQTGMRKAWAAGVVPAQVPVCPWMMRLPRRGFGLMLAYGVPAAILCLAVNGGMFRFYGFETWTFGQFMLYKLVYSLILSERLIRLCILRMVQADCDPRRGPPPSGKEAAP